MKDGNYTALRVASWGILFVSLAIQALYITYQWWNFDPRVSCERLIRWDERISCMHGRSHAYVLFSESAVVTWFVAGLAALAARMLPPYISIIAPGGATAYWLLVMIDDWNVNVVPYAEFGVPSLGSVSIFALAAGLLAAYVVAPVAGAWLLGLQARTRRRLARQPKLEDAFS
jgi:hypothetical protein